MIRVGTAAWSLPRAVAEQFAGEGTHLARYARVLRATEINSSFYRAHSRETYARWAAATPRGFRFAVKLPGAITHESRLRRARVPLTQFLDQVRGLGSRLGPVLIQVPASFAYEPRPVRSFLLLLRDLYAGPVVCEPRHASWFAARADETLQEFRVGRVAADPAPVPAAARPGGWSGITYLRLHGAPRMYWSVYEAQQIERWKTQLLALPRRADCWCIFDNTAAGGAAANALQLVAALQDAL